MRRANFPECGLQRLFEFPDYPIDAVIGTPHASTRYHTVQVAHLRHFPCGQGAVLGTLEHIPANSRVLNDFTDCWNGDTAQYFHVMVMIH